MVDNLILFSEYKDKYVIDESNKGYYLKIYNKLNQLNNNQNQQNIIKTINNDFINKFVEIMKSNKKEKYLRNLYNNLRFTRIVDSEFIKSNFNVDFLCGVNIYHDGIFYLYLGEESIEESKALLTPYHELLHLMTTKALSPDIMLIGLSSNSFGEGINEGYTEILTKRYFKELGEEQYNTYIQNTLFVDMIQEIVSKEKLEYYYFNADQDGLIEELSKYSNVKSVINSIFNIDTLTQNDHEIMSIYKELDETKDYKNIENFRNLYEENYIIRNITYKYLLNIYVRKQKKLLSKKVITEEEYKINIETFSKKNQQKKRSIDLQEKLYKDFFSNIENHQDMGDKYGKTKKN